MSGRKAAAHFFLNLYGASMPLTSFLDIVLMLLIWSKYRLLSSANHSGVSQRQPRLPRAGESEILPLISL